MMEMLLQLILASYIVHFELTFSQLYNQITDQNSIGSTNHWNKIQGNFWNQFSSGIKIDPKKSKIFQILKDEPSMGQRGFEEMKEELQTAQNVNANKRRNFFERSQTNNNIMMSKRNIDNQNDNSEQSAKDSAKKKTEVDDADGLGDEENPETGAKKKKAEVDDYADPPEDESYEQRTDADIFYEDAIRHALQILWKHRFHISRANCHLVDVLGRNATETKTIRDELDGVRDIIDRKRAELWNKLEKKSTLSEMTSAPIIEQSVLDKLTQTWKSLTKVFDVHQPQNRTLEFSETYQWMQNADNNTSGAYKKVNWLTARIKKMRPINQ